MTFRIMLKSKIHRATVTDANIDYAGSITIDRELLKAADILEYEQVHVLDISNGNRLETYVMAGEAGSGLICLNGAAARLVARGDKVIIISYALVADTALENYQAKVVLVDERNMIEAVNCKGPGAQDRASGSGDPLEAGICGDSGFNDC